MVIRLILEKGVCRTPEYRLLGVVVQWNIAGQWLCGWWGVERVPVPAAKYVQPSLVGG